MHKTFDTKMSKVRPNLDKKSPSQPTLDNTN